jgi:hypothetical protein
MPSTPWLGQADVTVCSVTAANGNHHAATLVVRRSTLTTARAFFDEAKASGPALDVSGLGEDAFYRPAFGDVRILVADTEFQVLIAQDGTPPAAPSDRLISLAKRILSRI